MLFSFTLHADEVRYYDTEIIIYENLSADNRNAEQWSKKMEREIPEMLVEISGAWPGDIPKGYDPKLSFMRLPASQWRLKTEAEKIDSSTSRRVLAHVAWVQPGLSQGKAISVHFNRTIAASSDTGEIESPLTPTTDASVPGSGTLDALIRISLARYLRVETDVVFMLDSSLPIEETTQNENSAPENEIDAIPEPRYFHIQQLRRRIRSTELHYLDHPVVGMLIMFTPHKTSGKLAAKKK